MTILIDIIWALFGTIMALTGFAYAYYLFNVQSLLDKYKSKDWRYDG
jgi:hypothetical protein